MGWRDEENIWKRCVGKTLIKAHFDDGDVHLVFPDFEVVGSPAGDCCSHSWVENLDDFGTSGKFVKVEEVDSKFVATDDQLAQADCLSLYCTKILTTEGEVLIDYRNDSNGYYGGYLNWSIKNG